MKYRGRTDIFAQILLMANGGATKTKILYGANLSTSQLNDLLNKLVESGLVEYSQGEEKFRTTEKGFRFLDAYDELSSISGTLQPEKPRLYR
ncbi:MAG TPA: winged helix-turn-helix domain-containing protein [Nitrososphaera sp.]|nr:winged helix-turn-helix domain-containing protein [Nitrososphaera sp.]